MKSSTAVLGLSALALAWPVAASAKRLREPVAPASAASVAAPADAAYPSAPTRLAMADDEFARMDLNLMPPPGASADPPLPTRNSGGLSTELTWPRTPAWGATPSAVQPVAPERAPADRGPRFDLVVNNAPASQVFLQLGAGAGVNVLVPPEVKGNISINLRAVNLGEALESLRELYGYDFKVSGNRVFVYPNTVQTRIYQVNYLAAQRNGASSLRVNSPGRAGSSSGATTSSSSGTTTTTVSSGGLAGTPGVEAAKVSMQTSTDFWRDLQASLKELLGSGGADRSIVINPAAGVLVVRASPAEHRQVADYLRAMRMSVERQVMLEAKIVEVTLTNETQSGVNWSLFRSGSNGSRNIGIGNVGAGVTLNQGSGTLSNGNVTVTPGSAISAATTGTGFYGLALQAGNFAALLNFLQTQGDIQVLSSPRIATLNNQKAVLKVGNDAYYPISLGGSTSSSSSSGSSSTVTPPTVDTMFSGIVLDVTPRIDENGSILLHVHPIISNVTLESVTYKVNDSEITGDLPKIAVNETDSIVRVLDRQIVAIGGLMRESSDKSKSGMTGLSDLPVVGALFRQKTVTTTKSELVVLIKPTVINEDGEGFERPVATQTAAE